MSLLISTSKPLPTSQIEDFIPKLVSFFAKQHLLIPQNVLQCLYIMSDQEAMDGSSKSEELAQMAKLHIEEIRTQKFYIGSDQANPKRDDLLQALTNLPKDANFLRELILNADENEYEEGVEPMLRIVMTEKDITGTGAPATMLLWKNEVGFSRENMDCICDINQSKKKGKKHQQTGNSN